MAKKYCKNVDNDPEIGHFDAASGASVKSLSMTIAEMNGVFP